VGPDGATPVGGGTVGVRLRVVHHRGEEDQVGGGDDDDTDREFHHGGRYPDHDAQDDVDHDRPDDGHDQSGAASEHLGKSVYLVGTRRSAEHRV